MKYTLDENGFYIAQYSDDFELQEGVIFTTIDPNPNFVRAKLVEGVCVEGATPEEIEAHNMNLCPQTITRRQLRKQLVIDGFDLAVIESMITDPLTLIDLQDSTIFERQNESVILIGTALQIDLNQFFTNASLL